MKQKESVNHMLNYIEANIESIHHVKEISLKSHYSNSHYNRLFLKEMGQSVKRYIKYRRIKRSSHLLRYTDKQIIEITYDVGFSNIDTFTRNFKDVYGMTPSDYRKENNHFKVLKEEENELMLKFGDEIKKCTSQDRIDMFEVVDDILKLSKEAHQKGLLELESYDIKSESKYLKKAIDLLLEGIEANELRNILENYIASTDIISKEVLRRVLYLEGILAIQKGAYPWEIRRLLLSLLGEEVMEEAQVYFSSKLEIKKLEKIFLDLRVGTNDHRLSKSLKDFNMRQMQRLTRECDLLALMLASLPLDDLEKSNILKSLSKSNRLHIMELFALLESYNHGHIIDSQEMILEVIQALKRSNDI